MTIDAYLNLTLRPITQNIWTSDIAVLIDSGARLLEGQIPHNDFYAPIGITLSLLVAFGLWTQNHIEGILHASLIFGTVMSLVVFHLASRRFHTSLAVIIAYFVFAFCTSLRPMGFSEKLISTSLLYNRMAWAFLTVIFLEFCFTRGRTRWTGYLSGASLSFLLNLKFNLFICGLGVVAMRLFIDRDFAIYKRALITLILTTLVLHLSLMISPFAFMRDMKWLLFSTSTFAKLDLIFKTIFKNSRSLAFVTLALITHTILSKNRRETFIKIALPALGVSAVSVIAGAGINGEFEFPLLIFGPLIILNNVQSHWISKIPIVVTLSLIGISLNANMKNFLYRQTMIVKGLPAREMIFYELSSERLKGLLFVTSTDLLGQDKMRQFLMTRTPDKELNAATEAMYIDDGLRLVEKYRSFNPRVSTMWWTNVIASIGGYRHPKNDALCYYEGRVTTAEYSPSPEDVFSQTDILLWPSRAADHTFAAMVQKYSKYIDQNFQPLERSDFWVIYKNKSFKL